MNRRTFSAVAALSLLLLARAAAALQAPASTALDPRRARILAVAESYARHEWRASEKNALHGADPDGVRVDTPDVSEDPKGWKPGGVTNVGVPYQWGGFSTLEEFDRAVAEGKLAGHVPRSREVDMSRHAVGVDCSGLVSLAWDLPRKYSTRSLGGLCYRLDSAADLLPGDVLNAFNGHVVIVKAFADGEKTRIRAYEAAIPCVVESEHDVAALVRQGYVPMRYKPLDPRFAAEAVAFRDPPRDLGPARFEPAPGEPLSAEAAKALVLALPSPFAGAKTGDWVAVKRRTTRSELGGIEEAGTLFRGVSRREGGSVTVHERLEMGGKRLDTLEPASAEGSLVDSLVRKAGGAGSTPPAVTGASVRKGTYVLGDARYAAEAIAFDVEARVPAGDRALAIRIGFAGILSDAVPLGGFLETTVTIRFADGPRTVDVRHEERLLDLP